MLPPPDVLLGGACSVFLAKCRPLLYNKISSCRFQKRRSTMEHWHRSGQALLNEISTTRLPASQLGRLVYRPVRVLFKYEDTVVCIDRCAATDRPQRLPPRYPPPLHRRHAGRPRALHPRPRRPHGKRYPARADPASRRPVRSAAGCSPSPRIRHSRQTASQRCRKVPSCRWAGSPSGPFPPPTRSTFWMRAPPAWRWGISLPSAALRSCTWATPT